MSAKASRGGAGWTLAHLLPALLLGMAWDGRAQATWFTKIADTSTAIPGGSGNFLDVGVVGVVDGVVVFSGLSRSESMGIYARAADGTLSKVVDYQTPIPGGTANFNDIGQVTFDGQRIAFVGGLVGTGRLPPPIDLGVFATTLGGSVTRLVDSNTPVPGGTGTFFTPALGVAISNGQVAFYGINYAGQEGIYLTNAGGPVMRVADMNTPNPSASGNFGQFYNNPLIANGVVIFSATDTTGNHQGVYMGSAGGPVSPIADVNTAIPGGIGHFEGASPLSANGDKVAFLGAGSLADPNGLYVATLGGGIVRVVDGRTGVPDGSGYFGSIHYELDGAAVEGQNLLILTLDSQSGHTSIYADVGGVISKVLAPGDLFDGKVVESAGFTGNLNHGEFGFGVDFSDGSEGIYLGHLPTVPEPSSFILVALGSLAAAALIRKRSNGDWASLQPPYRTDE